MADMEKIKFENAKKGLCTICGENIEMSSVWICSQCLKHCDIDNSRILETTNDKMLIDAKSICCNADVRSTGRLTCSDTCHEKFVKQLETEFGEMKKVTDTTTGITYKVPTRDIIEKGITWQDLPKYPQLDE